MNKLTRGESVGNRGRNVKDKALGNNSIWRKRVGRESCKNVREGTTRGSRKTKRWKTRRAKREQNLNHVQCSEGSRRKMWIKKRLLDVAHNNLQNIDGFQENSSAKWWSYKPGWLEGRMFCSKGNHMASIFSSIRCFQGTDLGVMVTHLFWALDHFLKNLTFFLQVMIINIKQAPWAQNKCVSVKGYDFDTINASGEVLSLWRVSHFLQP